MNNIDLKNRTAIVTGAAQGFGLAISERLIDSGACLETESMYLDITNTKGMPRHSH